MKSNTSSAKVDVAATFQTSDCGDYMMQAPISQPIPVQVFQPAAKSMIFSPFALG